MEHAKELNLLNESNNSKSIKENGALPMINQNQIIM